MRRLYARGPAVVVAVQLCAILVCAGFVVGRFGVFADDEGAHMAYIDGVAEHGRLPDLRDPVPWQVEALWQHTYPRHSRIPSAQAGLAAESYEAFQPPLYYLIAAPAYRLGPSDYVAKVRVARSFDVLLLAVTIALLALLARAIFAERWLSAWAMANTVLLWPGVLVRAITVSNAALETPVVLLFVYACWQATTRRAPRWLLATGAAAGVMVLTSLTIAFLAVLMAVPLTALLRIDRSRRALIVVAATIALPVVMATPWVAMNENRYGAATGGAVSKRQQMRTINPLHHHFDFADVRLGAKELIWAALPQEWWVQLNRPKRSVIMKAVPILLVALGAMAFLHRWRPTMPRGGLLLGSSLLIGIVVLAAGVLVDQWPILLVRYLNPEFTLFGLLAAPRYRTERGAIAVLGLAALFTALIAAIWLALAYTYWYPRLF